MRIGLFSIIGDGFGNGSFVFGEVPSGGGGNQAGDYAYTAYGVTYPIAEGGAAVTVYELTSDFPSQICDVDYIYEEGGVSTVPDWSTVSNIQYRPNGFYHAGDGIPTSQTPVEVPFESGTYYDSEYITEYAALANGSGGYTWTAYGVGYWAEDTFIYDDGTDAYFWNGTGGYYSTPL
jgi:hypothetical protein